MANLSKVSLLKQARLPKSLSQPSLLCLKFKSSKHFKMSAIADTSYKDCYGVFFIGMLSVLTLIIAAP